MNESLPTRAQYRPFHPQIVVARATRSARQGDCSLCRRKAFDPGLGTGARLFEAAERTRLHRPEPRLQAARHHDVVRSARSRHRKDHRSAFKATPSCRVPRLHEQPIVRALVRRACPSDLSSPPEGHGQRAEYLHDPVGQDSGHGGGTGEISCRNNQAERNVSERSGKRHGPAIVPSRTAC